jgi:hypothetical protein
LEVPTLHALRRAALNEAGGFKYPPSQTPWQEIQRGMVDQLADLQLRRLLDSRIDQITVDGPTVLLKPEQRRRSAFDHVW